MLISLKNCLCVFSTCSCFQDLRFKKKTYLSLCHFYPHRFFFGIIGMSSNLSGVFLQVPRLQVSLLFLCTDVHHQTTEVHLALESHWGVNQLVKEY